MISLRIIPKVLFRPGEAFEELRGNVTRAEGVVFFLSISLISLFTFGFFARLLRINIMAVPFGFGPVLTLGNTFLFLTIEFFSILMIAYIANWIALKFGGSGNYNETFTFFCYAKSLNFVQAIASIFVNIWLFTKIVETIKVLNTGKVFEAAYLLQLVQVTTVLYLFFALWLIYILTNAVSVEHNIPKSKSLVAVITASLISGIALFLVSYLAGLVLA